MKKVKLNYTKQGYSYVKCQKIDCLQWGGLAICDDCCKTMQDDVYLIFVLVRAIALNALKNGKTEQKDIQKICSYKKKDKSNGIRLMALI